MAATEAEEIKPGRAQRIIDLEKQYLIQNYGRYPLVLDHGKGCYLYDTDGKRYLDLISGIGVNALGHAHPRITKVLREQAGLLVHCSNLYYHEYQGTLAKRLSEISGLQRSFFGNSGTEVTEGAMKMCRSYGKRSSAEKVEIVALENSFHGRSMGALSITGQAKYRAAFEPLIPGVRFAPANDIGALEQVVGERTCGIIIEGIQGEGGIFPITTEYLERARELATRFGALLVFDEIQCGVGRPGAYFSYQLLSRPVKPDVVITAKPLACGLPLGAILATDEAASAIGPGMHGSTFGGGALACRVALEFLDILDELMPSIVSVGNYFRAEIRELAKHYRFIKEVRGAGLMIGVDLDMPGKQFVTDGMAEGLLFNCTHDTVLRFLPPYILTETHVNQAVKTLKKLFKKV